jgi:hypothetical protein
VRVQLQREHAPCSAHGGEAAQWQQAQRSAARGRQRGVRRRRWWPLACRRREAPWLAVSASGALPRDALLERTRAVCGLDGQRSGSAGEWTRVTCDVWRVRSLVSQHRACAPHASGYRASPAATTAAADGCRVSAMSAQRARSCSLESCGS